MGHPLVWAMAAHVAWAALLYAMLTVARAPAAWGVGRTRGGGNPFAAAEPRIAANLSNQFEWPLFFHVACLLLVQRPATPVVVALAWVFVAGRVLHSAVQVATTNVRLRGLVFTVNFLATLLMWGVLLWPQGASPG